mgnify:CR=1 FL=1
MSPAKVLAEIFGAALAKVGDGNPRSVGADQGAGFSVGFDPAV